MELQYPSRHIALIFSRKTFWWTWKNYNQTFVLLLHMGTFYQKNSWRFQLMVSKQFSWKFTHDTIYYFVLRFVSWRFYLMVRNSSFKLMFDIIYFSFYDFSIFLYIKWTQVYIKSNEFWIHSKLISWWIVDHIAMQWYHVYRRFGWHCWWYLLREIMVQFVIKKIYSQLWVFLLFKGIFFFINLWCFAYSISLGRFCMFQLYVFLIIFNMCNHIKLVYDKVLYFLCIVKPVGTLSGVSITLNSSCYSMYSLQ